MTTHDFSTYIRNENMEHTSECINKNLENENENKKEENENMKKELRGRYI
jgi:hypothetical protein